MINAEVFEAEPGLASFHGHAAWHACAVLAGGFEEVVDGRATPCEAGALRVSRPGAHHELHFTRGARCLVLEAESPFWSGLLSRAVATHQLHRFGSSSAATLAQAAEALRGGDANAQLQGCFALGELIAGMNDEMAAPDWADDARAAIRESAGQISLSSVAANAGLHRADFADGFRRLYGFRPVEYRALQRVERALRLISVEDAPLAEIALDAGFSHQSHMTNAFRSILGQTPGSVRRAR